MDAIEVYIIISATQFPSLKYCNSNFGFHTTLSNFPIIFSLLPPRSVSMFQGVLFVAQTKGPHVLFNLLFTLAVNFNRGALDEKIEVHQDFA